MNYFVFDRIVLSLILKENTKDPVFLSRFIDFRKTRLKYIHIHINKRPMGKVQSLEVPGWKWDSISMDFVTALPKTRSGNYTIWVIVDRLTKSAVFIPIKETWKKKQLAKTYIKHVVRLHGVPKDIISDRDSRFLSKFWKKVQLNLGTTLKMSTAR